MSSPRPPRLLAFDYLGLYRYFLTILVDDRRKVFVSANIVDPVRAQLLRVAADHAFGIPAYCFMPDHLHALLEGQSDCSDFKRFVRLFKQRSGFGYKQSVGERLWTSGYFDHVLRDDEATLPVARYILENPILAGLSETIEGYAFSGWSGFELSDLQFATGLKTGGPTGSAPNSNVIMIVTAPVVLCRG